MYSSKKRKKEKKVTGYVIFFNTATFMQCIPGETGGQYDDPSTTPFSPENTAPKKDINLTN